MRWLLLVTVLLPLMPTGRDTQALNESARDPLRVSSSLAVGDTVCISTQRATESNLKQVDYRDCLPLLNEILLEPNTNRQNQYDAGTAHRGLLHHTCSIDLLSRSQAGSDVFWGYAIAVAAANVVKNCVQDSADRYGGLEFTTSKALFYARVRNPEDGSAARTNPTGSSLATGTLLLASNDGNTTLLWRDPAAAIPVCQISQRRTRHLHPVRILDCYHLFYNLLTNPAVERTVILRGLSPVRYETYGTCHLQLRGNSAVSADTFKFVELLLAAVNIVQTCVLRGGLELGGAVGVGPKGQYIVRIFNPLEDETGNAIQSE